jgi:dTMP kinase
MKSKIIVIEGLDGSGKATQTKILAEMLENKGYKVRKLEFPDYANPSSSLVKMYLNGDFGSNPSDVNAYAASAFYAVDRVASYLQFWKKDYEDGTVILSDRYATSNIIYQMSKVDDSQRDDFIEWQSDFEYNKLGIPQPDAVIYLDVEPEVSQKLMEKRYGGDMSKMDLHERNVKFLLDCRKSALYAAEKCNWKVINCCENGDIKTIDKISEEIKEAIFDIL